MWGSAALPPPAVGAPPVRSACVTSHSSHRQKQEWLPKGRTMVAEPRGGRSGPFLVAPTPAEPLGWPADVMDGSKATASFRGPGVTCCGGDLVSVLALCCQVSPTWALCCHPCSYPDPTLLRAALRRSKLIQTPPQAWPRRPMPSPLG